MTYCITLMEIIAIIMGILIGYINKICNIKNSKKINLQLFKYLMIGMIIIINYYLNLILYHI